VLLGASFGTLEELLNGEIALNPVALIMSVVLIAGSIARSQVIKRREGKSELNEDAEQPK
jgi:hypothetical protein